ncbi:MAG: hypothetical protein MJZ20_00275 [Bacteroidaceae bacterium]|nr:hypothetical protein [Bacteroidaceae bacterium]
MKNFSIIMVLLVSLVCFSSCNGKSAKIGKSLYKELKKVNESDGVRYLKMKNRMNQLENVINEYNVCSTCGGYGVVYWVDEDGYYDTDSYGNPQIHICKDCGGDGKAF